MIVFRYLARQVMSTMLAVTLVLLLIFMSGRFIKYLAQAASGGLSPDILLQIMAYRLPGFLELILPLGFFLGILLAYGRMYLESEMTVLHACGYGRDRLLWHTMIMAMLVSLFVGAMSLYVSPWGMQKVERLFVQQSQLTEFEMLFPGKFQKLKTGDRVTYAKSLSDDKRKMFDVFISEEPDGDEGINLIRAKEGTQLIDPQNGDRYLVLHQGTRYQGVPGTNSFQVTMFDTYGVKIDVPDAEQRSVKEEAIPTQDLLGSKSPGEIALLQWRISIPMLVPVITLLGVALCKVNPRQGRFFHLLPSMMVYVVYLGLLIVVRKKLAKGEIPEYLGLWLVHLLFLGLAIVLLNKDRILSSMFRPKKVRASHA